MVWSYIYITIIVLGLISTILLISGKLIPEETQKKLSLEENKIYKSNLIQTTSCFTLAGIMFFVQNHYGITNLLIYVPIIAVSYYAVRKLVANLNLMNSKGKNINNKK